MLNSSIIIARNELKNGVRDSRALASSVFYSLMGPAVVLLVRAVRPGGYEVLASMASIFITISAFSGGMNLAMDTIAGERERRSLLPLLLNPITRMDVAVGKWLAVAALCCGGLTLNLFAFSLLLPSAILWSATPAMISLALFAAALELLVSTWSRSLKEAHTYLSFLVFVPMIAGLFAVFAPSAFLSWSWFAPILGQQVAFTGNLPIWKVLVSCGTTLIAGVLTLLAAGSRLERDDVVYGG